MAVTRIVTIVVDDDYEMDSEQMFDAITNLLPCACGFVEPPKAPCNIHAISMNSFKHADDECVDWEPVVVSINDDDDNIVIGKGGTSSDEEEV